MMLILLILFIVIAIVILFYKKNNTQKSIAIVSMMKNPKNIDYWLKYHRKKGITHFYIRLEDTPELVPYMSKQKDVFLIVGSSHDSPSSKIEYDAQMARQRDLAKTAIDYCIKNKIKWIIHIDSDELVECDGKYIYSTLENEINDNPRIHNIVMDNYEAKYSKINKKDDSCFTYKKLINCKNEKGCVSYVNGKSIGRVSKDLKEFGPHRFHINKQKYEYNSKKLRVLHFESCDFDSYVSKFINLSNGNKEYPFEFYNKSIQLSKSSVCNIKDSNSCKNQFEKLYTQYKL